MESARTDPLPPDQALDARTQEHLAQHPITMQLKSLGVTEQQLEAIHFPQSNRGLPFDQWSVKASADAPNAAVPLIKAYCTLRWLLLGDPPPSRDRDDAWRLMAEVAAAPTFAVGRRAKEAQRSRAKRPRNKLEDGSNLGEIIADLARKPEHHDKLAKELWPHFFAELEGRGLDPSEAENPSDPLKSSISYDVGERRKRISYGRFANIVATCRTKKSH